jgi:hypothetical protein
MDADGSKLVLAALSGAAVTIAQAHAIGARVLLDVYYALGVFPIDVTAVDVDFAVGGSYNPPRSPPWPVAPDLTRRGSCRRMAAVRQPTSMEVQ